MGHRRNILKLEMLSFHVTHDHLPGFTYMEQIAMQLVSAASETVA